MAQRIQGIFIDPPIAIARLGGSNAPQDAYRWTVADNPRSDGKTVIDPWWTLDVLSDGSVEPRRPVSVRLRDGDQIRPVAPFFEVRAFLGEDGSSPSGWKEVALTPALLRRFGADESSITLQFDAKNRKAARRMTNPDLVYGTHPPLRISGDDHSVHVLQATNPPDARRPLIPPGNWIGLGSVQIMRSRAQPKGQHAPWEDEVDVEVVRFRFTPGKGRFYGPQEAVIAGAVDAVNGFLNKDAGWYNVQPPDNVVPSDIYDMRSEDESDLRTLGVVDDTCEARATVELQLGGRSPRRFAANATILVGPPDFAPDRRPFLSLADELNDRRSGGGRRNNALDGEELEQWVQDLFERVYETASLFNLDHFQNERGILLTGHRLRRKPNLNDKVTKPRHHSMTRNDNLRSRLYEVPAASRGEKLPLYEHARTRHRAMQDIDWLKELIATQPNRLRTLIRLPFEVERGETADANAVGSSTMRMPPFMRNSNGFPLTLSAWQYELLMKWVDSVRRKKKVKKPALPKLSEDAQSRRDRVLAQLDGRRR
jgi:hypothetical protein